jgi:type I restriction enzyme S subunit
MNAERLLIHYDRIADAPDAISRLRRFILDLAVRGKLVQQDPTDEPASKLLERIAKEKSRLMKAGGLRDKPLLPAVADDEIPFALPSTWRWIRLANIVDFSAGRTPSRNDTSFWNTGDYAWVSIADMNDGQILTTTKETVSDKARKGVFGSEPEAPGTIIMSFKLTIGKIARLGIPAFHNEAIISIRPRVADLDSYLFKVLPQCARQGKTKGAVKGATLNRDSISNILFPLPPLAEQHRIVAKVNELMALCDRLDAARADREGRRDKLTAVSLARLNTPHPESFHDDARFVLNVLPVLTARPDQIKQLRQTILTLAVHGKLVPQDPKDKAVRDAALEITTKRRGQIREAIEEPFDLPAGWAWRAVDTIADQVTDGEHATPPRIAESQVPLVTAKNVRDGFMDYAQTDWVSYATAEKAWGRCRPALGDLLLVCVGATTGRLTVLREPRDMVLVRSVALIRPNREANPEYLERAIRSAAVQQQIWASVKAAAQPCLYINRIQSLLIPLPPVAEQRRIVAKVDELMALCDRLEASLTMSEDIRRRMLDALLAETLERSLLRRLILRAVDQRVGSACGGETAVTVDDLVGGAEDAVREVIVPEMPSSSLSDQRLRT